MEVNFPVYKLGSKPYIIDNVCFYIYFKSENLVPIIKIVDDKNIPEETLAKRRLKLLNESVDLKKINQAIFFLGDFIKLAKKHVWFIDSSGSVFEYEKNTVVPLVFKKITKLLPVKSGGLIVEVEGVPSRFKSLHIPNYYPKYAGLLEISKNSYILYGLFETQHKNTRRKV